MEEHRRSERKLVKVKALIQVDGAAALLGRTFDLGANGVGVHLDVPIKAGALARVSLALLINGVLQPMHAQARAQYCIFGSGVYRVGFQFLQLDPATAGLLARSLR